MTAVGGRAFGTWLTMKREASWMRFIPIIKKKSCSLSHGGHSERICSAQSFSHVQLFVTPCSATYRASPSITNSQSLLKFMSSESLMPSNHLIFCHSLLLCSIFPASGFFLISQFFTSSGQSIAASASASVLLMNIQGWFPLEFTDLFSLLFKWLARVCSNTTVQKHQFFNTQLSLWSNSHMHTWLLENQYFWPDRHFLAKWCLCFLICCLVLS